jgi:hypothetical protein
VWDGGGTSVVGHRRLRGRSMTAAVAFQEQKVKIWHNGSRPAGTAEGARLIALAILALGLLEGRPVPQRDRAVRPQLAPELPGLAVQHVNLAPCREILCALGAVGSVRERGADEGGGDTAWNPSSSARSCASKSATCAWLCARSAAWAPSARSRSWRSSARVVVRSSSRRSVAAKRAESPVLSLPPAASRLCRDGESSNSPIGDPSRASAPSGDVCAGDATCGVAQGFGATDMLTGERLP